MGPTRIKQHMVTFYHPPLQYSTTPLPAPTQEDCRHAKTVNALPNICVSMYMYQLYNLYEITSKFIVQCMK